MKKNLLKKVPLLLGGVMVLLSGCVKRADFEALTDRVTILEASLPEIQEQIYALQEADKSLSQLDESLKASIDDLKNANTTVGDRITSLQTDLQKQITDLNTSLSGQIDDLKIATKNNADAVKDLLTTVGGIEGTLSKLGDTYATDAELKAEVDKLNSAIEQAKTDLSATLGASFAASLQEYATLAALQAVKDDLAKIDLEKVKTEYTAAIDAAIDAALADGGKITTKVQGMIDAALTNIKERLSKLEETVGKLEGILDRIQSVVFVPEYTDGKATINYAKIGSLVVESQSKLTFQVYPAKCAGDFNAEGAEKLLSFCFKDVQSRASERRLEVAKVEGDAATGLINVYVNARDLAADFYKDVPTVHYAVSLVMNDTKANLASSYVNLIAIKEANAEVITANIDVTSKAYEVEYTDLTTKIDALKEHNLKFQIGAATELYTLAEMQAKGYDFAVTATAAVSHSDAAKADRFNNVDAVAADHIYTTVNLTDKVVKEDVGLVETINYNYAVDGVDVAAASATVEITKIKRAIALSVADIKWVYAEDAATDVTGATTSLDAATVVSSTVPEDTTWEQIIAVAPTTTVKEGDAVAAGVTATLGGTTDAKTIQLDGFAWGKTYAVEAVYELPNITVTVTTTVNTVDRARGVVELKLADKTVDIAQNLEFTTDTEAEALTALYDAVKADLGEMTEADYLKEVLVTKNTDLYTVNNAINGAEYTNSKVVIAADGLKAHVTYLYSDMTATPDVVEYVYDVTTWYGQQFKIYKNVTINKAISTYDFQHVATWVYEDPYYSAITPEYAYSNEAARNASAFSLANIVLNDAFLVKNTVTNETLDNTALAALGITLEYAIEDATVDPALLTVNSAGKYEFTYGTKADVVNISGHLKLATGVAGEVIELPTQFSNGLYANYYIKGFNPLEDHITKTEVDAAGNSLTFVELVEAKEYSTSVWSLLSIKDKRGFDLFENGAWVVGDDANGFAGGGTPAKPSDAAIYDAEMKFEIVSVENLPTEQAGKVNVTPESGILTFDYTNKFQAAKPIKVAVKATLTYKYGKTLETTLYYTFQTK